MKEIWDVIAWLLEASNFGEGPHRDHFNEPRTSATDTVFVETNLAGGMRGVVWRVKRDLDDFSTAL